MKVQLTFAEWLEDRLAGPPRMDKQELARRIDVSPSAVSAWANGKARPRETDPAIAKIATVFNVSYEEVARLVRRHPPRIPAPDEELQITLDLEKVERDLLAIRSAAEHALMLVQHAIYDRVNREVPAWDPSDIDRTAP